MGVRSLWQESNSGAPLPNVDIWAAGPDTQGDVCWLCSSSWCPQAQLPHWWKEWKSQRLPFVKQLLKYLFLLSPCVLIITVWEKKGGVITVLVHMQRNRCTERPSYPVQSRAAQGLDSVPFCWENLTIAEDCFFLKQSWMKKKRLFQYKIINFEILA